MDDNEQITATRADLVKAFAKWDGEAAEGNWPAEANPEASADHMIRTVRDVQF